MRLPNTFKEGVDSIMSEQTVNVVPAHRLEWIYQSLKNEGVEPSDREHWEVELSRVNRLDHFLLDWMECNPDKFNEVIPYFGSATQAALPLIEALKLGKGAFIASAHIGVLFGGTVALKIADLNASWLASIPDLGDEKFEGTLISTTTNNESSIGKKILKSLRQNKVVAIACDGNKSSDNSLHKIFNQDVKVSGFIPKFSFTRRVPCFFPKITWAGDKTIIDLIEMPQANVDESRNDYVERWCDFYLKNIENIIKENPASIRGSGGFWTDIQL